MKLETTGIITCGDNASHLGGKQDTEFDRKSIGRFCELGSVVLWGLLEVNFSLR
jgi:hypothetical protein